MQVLLELRDPTADGRQGNTQVAARGRETSHVDRGQQDCHRLQSIHDLPSTNERIVTKFTSYCDRLGGSILQTPALPKLERERRLSCVLLSSGPSTST